MEILIRIIIAHILADFFLQPYGWVKGKKEHGIYSHHIYLHILMVGLLTYLLLAHWTHWQLPLFIMVSHFLIDWWKTNQEDTVTYFIIDQCGHVLMLILGWMYFSGFAYGPGSFSFTQVLPEISTYTLLVLSTAYLIALRPLGFLIEKFTGQWRDEMEDTGLDWPGLNRAGTWIGYLERIIILTFILLNQYSGIGFLIAAKSIFRFSGAIKNKKDRMYAEYILIGTLISFTLALLLGLGMRYLLFK